jgi:hypothetical protein
MKEISFSLSSSFSGGRSRISCGESCLDDNSARFEEPDIVRSHYHRPDAPPNSLRELGMTSESNPIVSLSEFTYKKDIEIYGEKEPAEYVYQVKSG